MKIVLREAWGARAPKRRIFVPTKNLDGVVVHWFGKPRARTRHRDCPGLLRAVQLGHMTHPTEGYSDIAYGHGVCTHGVVFELRGFNVRVGANGNSDANSRYGAVVVMIGEGDRFTGEARLALRDAIREYWRRGAGRKVLCHGDITGSECPGDEVRAWVRARKYAVAPQPPPGAAGGGGQRAA